MTAQSLNNPGEPTPEVGTAVIPAKSNRTGFRYFLRRLFKRMLPRIGAAIVLLFVIGAVFAPILTPYDPIDQDYDVVRQPPSAEHWFGTDDLGRDMFTRILYGGRVSIFAAFIPLIISSSIGVTLGLIAGTVRGITETIIMRVMDALLSIPSILLMIVIAGILGPSLINALIAIGFVGVARYARVVYSETLSVSQREYVLASRSLGKSTLKILFQEILPNVTAPIIVIASLSIGGIILAEATLSFLGLGIQPPTPSWGSMVAVGNRYLQLAPWMSLVPGAAIFLMVMAVNFLGDGVRDALDPYLSGKL
ncbi:MAG: ABC transporter permease [Anaerolineales bacterium]|nr:ABC transporter permease [Anaerolineales bacterium]